MGLRDMGLRDKQQRFIEEYTVDFNATQAAIRAGYSEKTAAVIGHQNLRKLNIKEAIDLRLAELSLSATETLKSISDIARADLNAYFKVRKTVHVPQVEISLADFIARRTDEMDTLEQIHAIAMEQGLLGVDEDLAQQVERHENKMRDMQLDIVRMRVRLAKEPKATMIVDGPAELVEVVDLDLVKLTKDKAAGRIKSFSNTEHGAKVEMYPADAALRDLARYHGLYAKDNKLKLDHEGFITSVTVTAQEARDISKALEDDV